MSGTGGAPMLPTNRAFVVQFAAGADVAAGALCGRVEHVASAHAAHFHSLDELLAFIARVLSDATGANQLSSAAEGSDHSGPGRAGERLAAGRPPDSTITGGAQGNLTKRSGLSSPTELRP